MKLKLRDKRANYQDSQTTLELLYNVSREITAALDLRTVLQRVLLLSMKHAGAISGTIIVLDENYQPIDSAMISGDQILEHSIEQLRAICERGLAGWVIQNRQAVLLPDTSKDTRWLRRPDDADDRTGPKSAVSAPIQARDQLVGVMTLVHPTPGTFTNENLELVQAIAGQAGIAVLNARLYAESQRQTRVMTALAESAAAITASLKTEDVLPRILRQISLALQVEVVSLALIDPATEEVVFRAATGEKGSSVVGVRLALGQGIAGWVAKRGEGIIVPDVQKDERFFSGVDEKTKFTTRAIACAPIRYHGEVIGVLEALNPKDGIFDPDALQVLSGIGGLAGTAIRHAELFELLDAAHKRYHELFDDSIDPILLTDLDGRILEANRQAGSIFGVERQTLRGAMIKRFHFIDRGQVGDKFEKLGSGETICYETNLKTEGGREVPIQVYARSVLIEGIPRLQWILRDITERKNLDNLRNDLISMIYHDLRSPLANVVSSLDVLEAMAPKEFDPAIKSLLDIAIRSTERIQRLTNSLLDLRRLEAGQPIGNLQMVSPRDLAGEAVETVMPIVENRSQEVSMLIPEDLPAVWVDADMLRRVLTNLLENAVKYSPAGSKIYVGAIPEGGKVVMWVQDTGPGIPPDERDRIFDKFTRLHGRGGPKGLGLGLAFCRLAVEAHGGRIWVEDGPESGACFKFTLPTQLE